MLKEISFPEKFFCEIWKEQNFTKSLITRKGEKIQIIDPGSQNNNLAGPDFKNARIKIGNITYLGDVEIDSYYSDWRNHGHFLNKKYNKVILHTFLNNDGSKPYVYTQEGRKVNSISIENYLDEKLKHSLQKAILSERKKRFYKMPCAEINHLVDEETKINFLSKLGLERFKFKRKTILRRLKEIIYLKEIQLKEPVVRYDLDEKFYNREFTQTDFNSRDVWNQIFYENIFEALGYSKNKAMMRKLAEAVDINFLKRLSGMQNAELYFEAAFFNVSGIMPDVYNLPDEETSEYTKDLARCWNEIKSIYDGKTFNETDWHFFKLRPSNFPTIRIAGGSKIVFNILNKNLVGKIIDRIEKIEEFRNLIGAIRQCIMTKAFGYWRNHYVFDKPSNKEIKLFIGYARTDEIIVNVILPILSIYFEIFRKEELSKKVINIFSEFNQHSENFLVREVSTTLHLNGAYKRSVLNQGMINLHRNYCSKNKCLSCAIGKEVFT